MSWGERSCKGCRGIEEINPTPRTCNVDCEHYEWDGSTKPDSCHRELVHTHKQWVTVSNEGTKKSLTIQNTQKTGRNQSCPCGSGKKFKKCCIEKTL